MKRMTPLPYNIEFHNIICGSLFYIEIMQSCHTLNPKLPNFIHYQSFYNFKTMLRLPTSSNHPTMGERETQRSSPLPKVSSYVKGVAFTSHALYCIQPLFILLLPVLLWTFCLWFNHNRLVGKIRQFQLDAFIRSPSSSWIHLFVGNCLDSNE